MNWRITILYTLYAKQKIIFPNSIIKEKMITEQLKLILLLKLINQMCCKKRKMVYTLYVEMIIRYYQESLDHLQFMMI